MGLVNLNTNLKSLKYQGDTVGGGNSRQPYIRKPIPESFSEIGQTGGYDSLVRGGYLRLSKGADDSSRILQLLTDPTNFQGITFSTKLRTLSNQNVKTQVNTGKRNQGNYNNLRLLGNVAGSTLDAHIELFDTERYLDKVKIGRSGADTENRLIALTKTQKNTFVDDPIVGKNEVGRINEGITYSNAGYTRGVRNQVLYTYRNGWLGQTVLPVTNTTPDLENNTFDSTNSYLTLKRDVNFKGFDGFGLTDNTTVNSGILDYLKKDNTTLQLDPKVKPELRSIANYDPVIEENKVIPGIRTVDFRKAGTSQQLDSYRRNLIFGDAGAAQTKDPNTARAVNAYQADFPGTNLINFKYIYSNAESQKDPLYDYVDFHIAVYPNAKVTKQHRITYIHFPAYISGLSDTFTPEWSSHKVMGRGEKFYTYQGFDRSISLNFKVHAQSKPELLRQKYKLDYLSSLMYPDYSAAGIMQGNFVELTIGDWIVDMPGIIQGFTLTVPDNSPWQIHDTPEQEAAAKALLGAENAAYYDDSALPHLIEVSGFKFVPIQKTTPKRIPREQLWYDQLDPVAKQKNNLTVENSWASGQTSNKSTLGAATAANAINTKPYSQSS